MPYNNYEEFNAAKQACRDCYVGKVYDKVVPSDGNKIDPKVLIVGEAAGADEILLSKPFVGKCGKLLRSTLNKYGFRRSNALITNIMPCRPENNKFPKEDEIVKNCVKKWLLEEIELTKPKYVLLIGATPLKFLGGQKGITSLRGIWFDRYNKENILQYSYMPTYHPSYVLRKMYMEEGKQIMVDFENDIKTVAIRTGFIK